jgi:chemotaxis protein methyltransferase CheR
MRRDPTEREALRSLLVVTISRFFRNARVFRFLSREVLPRLAGKEAAATAWSAGCAAGEELYSLRIAWEELPGEKPSLRLIATDVDPVSLERAAAGRYPESSLREVPDALRRKYFEREDQWYRVREEVRRSVSFRKMELMQDGSPGRFDLILCRNTAFTYFGPDQRMSVARMFGESLEEGGYLVLGRTETLPEESADLFEIAGREYRLREILARWMLDVEGVLSIDGGDMGGGRYWIRFLDGDDRQFVVFEFDTDFAILSEMRADSLAWEGDDFFYMRIWAG